MEQVGYVEKVEGNIGTIMVKRVSSCGDTCASCKAACHIAGVRIKTEVPDNVASGDYVEITTETPVMLKHIVVLYGTPLVIMLGVIFVVMFALGDMPNADMISGFCGIASLALSYVILRMYDRRETKNHTVKYMVAKKL